MKKLRSVFIFITIVCFTSCQKDKPADNIEPSISASQGHRVYITSEGVFNSNNAGVTIYQPSTGESIIDYYKSQNNNAVLGDVCQSITKANNNFYLSVNNSGKIVVVSADDFKLKGTLTGLTSPRYVLPITFQKAYVSDLYSNSITIMDLNTFTKTGSIPFTGWSERMELLYNKAFVTNMKKAYTYVINTVNDQVIDSINTGINAGSLVLDKNNKLWILSSGDNTNSVAARLTKIDAVTLQTELSLNFNLPDAPNSLCINGTKDTLYFLNKNVYRMTLASTALPTSAFITTTSNNLYGIAVNDKDYNIYVSDAIDYIQKSSILVYSPQGQFKTMFKAGINSSNFFFE